MTEEPSKGADVHKGFEDALADLKKAESESADSPDVQATLRASAIMLQGMSAFFSMTIGECRRDEPFAELRPVIDASGNFRWCCTHEEEHCVDTR